MRIVIADDSVLLREGLALILHDEGHEIVASVADGGALVDAALEHRPDLIVSDIRMPPSHTDEGLRAAHRLRAEWPDAPILLLSQYVVVEYATELVRAGSGGIGYLLKDRVSAIDSFLASCAQVAGGGVVLDADVVSQVMRPATAARPHTGISGADPADPPRAESADDLPSAPRPAAPATGEAGPGQSGGGADAVPAPHGATDRGVGSLTPRERDVLELMARGHTNAAIARELVISVGAVEKNVQRVFAKLGLHDDSDVHRRVTAVVTLLSGR